MLRFVPFLLLLIGSPALAINDGQLDAVLKECKHGPVCPCPSAKIARIDSSVCGPDPKTYVDGQGNFQGGKALDEHTKCVLDVLDENNKIDEYNNIFANCQRSHASDEKTKFTNLPPIYSGDGKTLNEQVQDVKAAERAKEQALREEEAAGQAQEDRAYAAAHRPLDSRPTDQQQQPAALMTADGRHVIRCIRGFYGRDQLICLTLEPSTETLDHTSVNGLEASVTGNEAIYGNVIRPFDEARPYP
jgi:hypothetical protein